MEMEQLLAINMVAAGLVAWFLELVPPVKKYWDRLNPRQKQGINLLIVAAIVIGTAAYNCFYTGEFCPAGDFLDWTLRILATIILSLGVNQGAHRGVKMLPANSAEG